MSRFDRAALALTGLLVAGLYVLVASDSLTSKPQKKATEIIVPSLDRRSEVPSGPETPNAGEVVSLSSAETPAAGRFLEKPKVVYALRPSSRIEKIFSSIGYYLHEVRRHGKVPRVFIRTLPNDIGQIRRADQRKRLFIKVALPLILHVNDLIRQDRARIISLRERVESGEPLPVADRAWLAAKMARYEVASLDFDELLRRVDVIPPSLALAQSAEESGWGTSRFAREGNALFGQRIWRAGEGMVPEQRADGQTFRVRAFDHLIDGVKSYAVNLNTHLAYRVFRMARAEMRRSGERLNGVDLATALTQYSERGEDYVKTIHTIIRVNDLTEFDAVQLLDALSERQEAPET